MKIEDCFTNQSSISLPLPDFRFRAQRQAITYSSSTNPVSYQSHRTPRLTQAFLNLRNAPPTARPFRIFP